ncbi:MAG: hypothetical protein LBL81_03585 [Tannerella sp.]|jgi:hypothetical protein|nr:hypothetical protein [Tannerella sp.]
MSKKPKISRHTPAVKPIINDARLVFGFEYLQNDSYSGSKEPAFFISFLQRMKGLCSLPFNEILTSDRHSWGTENISIKSIKLKEKILRISEDITSLIAFRATGDNHAFLGFWDTNRGTDSTKVFQIVFIEANFGDIYDHGSK